MRLRPDQLPRQLARGLAPLYLVSGDEPLQRGEALDAVRAAAREAGFSERIVLDADGGFDWQELVRHLESYSLFGDKRLIELRLSGSGPGAGRGRGGDEGAKVLAGYAARPSPEIVLLVSAGRLDAKATKAKWFRALESAGVAVQVWPPESGRLPGWIQSRARAAGTRVTPEAAAALAERVEGNLLACAQEIEKLRILYGAGPVDVEQVYSAVADSARYDVFDLVESALEGEAARAVRITRSLREEGVEVLAVLGTLAWALRTLAEMAAERAAGRSLDDSLRVPGRGAWSRRKRALQRALGRHPRGAWLDMLAALSGIDRAVKGGPGDPWADLERLVLAVCGIMLFPGSGYNGQRAAG